MSRRSKWEDEREKLCRLRYEEKLSYAKIGAIYDLDRGTVRKIFERLHLPKLIKERKPKIIKSKKERKIWHIFKCEYCGKEFVERPGKNNNKYCSITCSAKARVQDLIARWKAGLHSGTSGFTTASFVRDYMFEKANYKCQKCGWGEENPYTHRIPLQIHHIDGNSLNNIESNLQVLCPNCHTLTENFGSRNKNAPNGKSHYYRRA